MSAQQHIKFLLCSFIIALLCNVNNNVVYGQFIESYECDIPDAENIVNFPFELSSVAINTGTSPAQVISLAEGGTLLIENVNTFGEGIEGSNTIANCLTSFGNDFEGITYLFQDNFRFFFAALLEGSEANDPNRLFLISTDADAGSNVSNCRVETPEGLEFAFADGSRLTFNGRDGLEGVTIDLSLIHI